MALFDQGMICHFCQEPINSAQDLLGFTFVASAHPLIQPLDDSVCHRRCLSESNKRDEFVRAWNREAMYALGSDWFLDVDKNGEVAYLSTLKRWLYAFRIHHSPFLPKPISWRRPLLMMKYHVACKTPFSIHHAYSGASSFPSPQRLGLADELCESIEEWVKNYNEYQKLAGTYESEEDLVWQKLDQVGYSTWTQICGQIGELYTPMLDKSGNQNNSSSSVEQFATTVSGFGASSRFFSS